MAHCGPTQTVLSESQESLGQKINTKVLFFSITLFSEKKSWRLPSSFLWGEKSVFAAISDRLFSYVLSSELPGRCVINVAELFQNHSNCNVGQSHLFQWLLPSAGGCLRVILERFYWVCESLSIKGANTQKNVCKANVFIPFGDLPSHSSFKH